MKLRICGKTSDLCNTQLFNEDGETLAESNGYVPDGIGFGGGDYIEFYIDVETGQILNWPKFTNEEIIEAIKEA